MLIGEAIQLIQSDYSKGVQSDDTRLSNRHIYAYLIGARNLLFEQSSDKRQFISQWNYQPLPCVEMISVPLLECPVIPPSGCNMLRSKHKLPRPLVNLNRHMLQSVTTIDGLTHFGITEFHTRKYSKGAKYTSSRPGFLIRDMYGWLTTSGFPQAIAISGIWEDPIKASQFPKFCEETVSLCGSYLDLEFPADSSMMNTLVKMATTELLRDFRPLRNTKNINLQSNLQQPDGMD